MALPLIEYFDLYELYFLFPRCRQHRQDVSLFQKRLNKTITWKQVTEIFDMLFLNNQCNSHTLSLGILTQSLALISGDTSLFLIALNCCCNRFLPRCKGEERNLQKCYSPSIPAF